MVYRIEQQYNEPAQQSTPSYWVSQELLIELWRWPRRRGRGVHKQRDKTDVSTLPPKPKKPVKVSNAVDNKVDYGKCPICWKPAISAMWYCGDHY